MRSLRLACHVFLFASLILVAGTGPSHAYVDPGSASIVVTAILGGIAAVGYTMRLYWERLKSFFTRAKQAPSGK